MVAVVMCLSGAVMCDFCDLWACGLDVMYGGVGWGVMYGSVGWV